MDKFDMLIQHSTDMRIDVKWATDLPDFVHGFYEDAERSIYLNYYCRADQVIAALAHEIGHGIFGDRCSSEAIERRADEAGASLVITRSEYARAERLVGPHPDALAIELEVTRDLILAWRRWWLKYGRLVA